MKELVSIIVPVYNVEGLICETMDCVRAQTWQCWELLLVEDGSSDGTIQVIKRYMEEKGDGWRIPPALSWLLFPTAAITGIPFVRHIR